MNARAIGSRSGKKHVQMPRPLVQGHMNNKLWFSPPYSVPQDLNNDLLGLVKYF